MNNLADLLKTETDKRLLRLFAVGCCRQIWDKLIDDRSRTAVEVIEEFADGQATQTELNKARDAAWAAVSYVDCVTVYSAAYNAAWAVAWAAGDYVDYWVASTVASTVDSTVAYTITNDAAHAVARGKQLELYHCIFTEIVFSTINQNIINLAKLIYGNRQWQDMPILGDALEDDGCPEEAISHCKEKEHARGCWVVDSILGKR